MSITKPSKPKVIVVCGPTGSGKTSLAALLCKKFNGEIVNADSRQVYKYMNIGTAKDLDVDIPQHLIDIVDPDDRYSVGRFKRDAEKAIEDIISRAKVPFIVGGTGLYIDALVENYEIPTGNAQCPMSNDQSISNIPASPAVGQYPISEHLNNMSLDELVKLLEKVDPDAMEIVDLKNRRRVEKALEVYYKTGVPFTKQRKKGERKYEVLKLSPTISLDREALNKKIDQRVDEMIEQGLEKEVKGLAEKYGWESEAMTGIGYREWKEKFENIQYPCLAGRRAISNIQSMPNSQISNYRKNAIEQTKRSSRNYAKRQTTWFKRDKDIHYVELKEAGRLVQNFLGK